MPNVFSPNFQKIIGQVLFRPTLDNLHNVALVAKEIESEFEEWRANKSSDVDLFSPESRELFQLTASSLTFLKEGKSRLLDTGSPAISKSKRYLKETLLRDSEFSIEKIQRIGFRTIQTFESDFNFNDLADLIYKKFYSNSESLTNICGDVIEDVAFVVNSTRNGLFVHTKIGPMTKDEALKTIDSNFELEKNIEKEQLFIDIDVSVREGLSMENADDIIDKIIQENIKIAKEYLDYLSTPV